MFIEKSNNLIKLIEQRKVAQENADKVHGLKTRRSELEMRLREISPLVQTCLLFRKNGIDNYNDDDFVDKAIELIQELKINFDKNPVMLNQPQSILKVNQVFFLLQSALKTALTLNWQTHVDSLIPTTNEELMGVLGKIPAFSPTINTVRRSLAEISSLKASLPRGQQDIQRLKEKSKELKNTWQKLGSDDVPTAVLQFLRAAVTGGASLNLLIDEVEKWLSDHNISSSFKIYLSRW